MIAFHANWDKEPRRAGAERRVILGRTVEKKMLLAKHKLQEGINIVCFLQGGGKVLDLRVEIRSWLPLDVYFTVHIYDIQDWLNIMVFY